MSPPDGSWDPKRAHATFRPILEVRTFIVAREKSEKCVKPKHSKRKLGTAKGTARSLPSLGHAASRPRPPSTRLFVPTARLVGFAALPRGSVPWPVASRAAPWGGADLGNKINDV